MPICRDIIKSAYRRSGIIGQNATPNSTQMNIGLERLQELYDEMLSSGLLGRLTDYRLVTGNYVALEWQRIHKVDGDSVITIPTSYNMSNNEGNPNDYGFSGFQITTAYEQIGGGISKSSDGQTRSPLDGAVIVIVDESTGPDTYSSQTHVWDIMFGWVVIESLTLSGYAPFTRRHAGGIKNLLAVHLLDENGLPISPLLAKNAASFRLRLASKYDQPRASGQVEYM